MGHEPVTRRFGDDLQCARLLEQVRRSRHDDEATLAAQLRLRVMIEAEHDIVVASDNEQSWSDDRGESVRGEIGAPSSGNDRHDPCIRFGGRPKCRGGPGAGAEVSDF